MRYFASRIKREAEERIYRIYVADSLYYRGKGMALTKRYTDVLHPKVETRDVNDIIADVTANLGLKVT